MSKKGGKLEGTLCLTTGQIEMNPAQPKKRTTSARKRRARRLYAANRTRRGERADVRNKEKKVRERGKITHDEHAQASSQEGEISRASKRTTGRLEIAWAKGEQKP